MITRYEQEDMSAIWEDLSKFGYFLVVEKSLAHVLGEESIIPARLNDELEKVEINVSRIKEIENEVGHDVIAFCQSIEEQLTDEVKSFFHFGVTSSDIIDSALMLQLKKSSSLILLEMGGLLNDISDEILKTSDLLCVGRTHGIYAEPMIFAHKWLSFKAEFSRRYEELKNFSYTGQVSGAIGTYSILTPAIEKKVLGHLGLESELVSTQVIPRDRILSFVQIIAGIGVALERMAVEFRHLQHSDVAEVFEGFSRGQKGSSIMPHKKNPISFENITGISRLLQHYSSVASSNCALWHERDLSHSSNERIYLPDMLGLSLYSLRRARSVIKTLHYDRENIEAKVFKHPQVFSSLILHRALTKTRRPRSEVYQEVQKIFHGTTDLGEIQSELKRVLDEELILDQKTIRTFYQNKFQENLKGQL